MPVQRAAEHCPWLKTMVDAGEIFHPLRWTAPQALQFLKDASALESAGVVVRMPASWRMNRPARPQVKATVGGKQPSTLGMDALLDFKMEVTLDGESLTKAEIKQRVDNAARILDITELLDRKPKQLSPGSREAGCLGNAIHR